MYCATKFARQCQQLPENNSRPSAADIVKHTLHSRRVMSGEGDVPVTGADFERLFSAISAMEGKVLNLKRELAEEQEAANEGLAKRMKSHEKQYCFNETVKDKIQEAQTVLNQSAPALEKAKSALTEGEKLIDERQKQIRIADRSEYVWATVEEYLDDELARIIPTTRSACTKRNFVRGGSVRQLKRQLTRKLRRELVHELVLPDTR